MTRHIFVLVLGAMFSIFGLVGAASAQQGSHIAVAVSQDGRWAAAMVDGMEAARREAISLCESRTDRRCTTSTSEVSDWYYVVLRCREGYITAGSAKNFDTARYVGALKFGYTSYVNSTCDTVTTVSADDFRPVQKQAIATNDYGWAPGVGYSYEEARRTARDLCHEMTGEACWRVSAGSVNDRFVVVRCNGRYTSALVTSTYESAKQEAASRLGLATAQFCVEVRTY